MVLVIASSAELENIQRTAVELKAKEAAACLGESKMSETLRIGRISLKSGQQTSGSCCPRSLWKLMV